MGWKGLRAFDREAKQSHRLTITEREQARNKRLAEVQALVDQGMSYRGIALELGTSYNTVRRLLGKC